MEPSEFFPRLHANNLRELKSALRHPKGKDGVWVHGDGNIYFEDHNSKDRVLFRNPHPDNADGGYRVKYLRTDALPNTLKELEQALIKAAQKEKVDNEKQNSVRSTNPNALSIEGDDEAIADDPGPKLPEVPESGANALTGGGDGTGTSEPTLGDAPELTKKKK